MFNWRYWLSRKARHNIADLLESIGDEDVLKTAILLKDTRDLNVMYKNYCTVLFFSISLTKPNTLIIGMLLDKHADPNIPDKMGRTPLHAACEIGNADVVHLLLEYGAHTNVQDKYGVTALDLARRVGNQDCIKALI